VGSNNSSWLNVLGYHSPEEHPLPGKQVLAYITGSVNEDLLRKIEYLLEPSSILPFVNDEERKRSLWFRGDGRQMDWAVEPWQSHSGRLAVLHLVKCPGVDVSKQTP
jgi:hypothetical protein